LLDWIESDFFSSDVYVFIHFIGVDIFFISASVGLLRTQRLHLGRHIDFTFPFIFDLCSGHAV